MIKVGTGVVPPILLKSAVTARGNSPVDAGKRVRQSQAYIGNLESVTFLFDNMVHDYIF